MSRYFPPKPYEYVHDAQYEKPYTRILTLDAFEEWYSDNIVPLFENAVELSGSRIDGEWILTEKLCGKAKPEDMHTCVAINIRPIKEETAESLLREIVDSEFSSSGITSTAVCKKTFNKARKFLERQSK